MAKPSIVFAHGLWADGSCFSKLIPTLQAEGHEIVAYGGTLITHAGTDPRVAALVYIAALASDDDETSQGASFPGPMSSATST